MVCYARPAIRIAGLLIVALLLFGRTVSHFLDTAAFLVVLTVATGAAALVFAAFLSTRHRRAAAGGCVSCQYAMTGPPPRRLWLVSHADRTPTAETPGRAPSVLLPMPAVRPAGPAPRWPDQPRHRSDRPRERAGSTA